MTADDLKQGIFLLNTRRFGTVAEIMIKRIKKLGKAKTIFHDLFDEEQGTRVEVKFSTVRQKMSKLTEDNLLESIASEMSSDRRVPFVSWNQHDFWCNIQQIKKSEFDVLYYGLFFDDAIKIFRIEPEDINDKINYNNKQHKGNTGEGQFHITPKTLQTHLDHFFHTSLTYQNLLDLLSSK